MEGDFRVGEWLVRPELNRIEKEGDKRSIEPKVMDVLAYLADHHKEVLPKERILRVVWSDAFVGDEVLSRAIGELRKALGDDVSSPTYIETIPRRGYRLIADVIEEKQVATTRYRLLEEMLGHGAMGEVYLAEDQLLKRKVALKFLVEELAEDERAKKRFVREARAAAALDHPFICSVHDTGDLEGRTFIAMEYLEGQTLKDRMSIGALPLKDALKIASEVAEALEKAHAAGIIHRDLKPANIMLTPEGHAKVMDFGLAKQILTEDEGMQDLSSTLTREGAIVGTLSYMSPEQVRGDSVDHRTDLFSFGVVLYQMLTGVHPFRRDKAAETTSAILQDDPAPLGDSLGQVSELLQHMVSKMLAKSIDDRYQGAHEIRSDLRNVIETGGRQTAQPAAHSSRYLLLAFGGLAILAVVVGGLWLYDNFLRPSRQFAELSKPVPFTTWPGEEWNPSFSPDGNWIAFNHEPEGEQQRDIWIKQLDGGSQIQLTDSLTSEQSPTWNPEGTRIAFLRTEEEGSGSIVIIPAFGGGAEQEVLSHQELSWGLDWSPDGKQLAFSRAPSPGMPYQIFLLDLDTLEQVPLTSPPEGFRSDHMPSSRLRGTNWLSCVRGNLISMTFSSFR